MVNNSLVIELVEQRLHLSEVDIFCEKLKIDRASFFNECSIYIAKKFQLRTLTYAEADAAINSVSSLMTADASQQGDGFIFAEPAFSIYLAFDRGEYSLKGDIDPVEQYTRPLIFKILENL